jgi:hypothetical protein
MNLKTSFYTLVSIILILATPSFVQSQGSFFGSDTLSLISPAPRLSVGYMFPSGPTTLKLDIKGGPADSIKRLTQSYKLQGLWAELAIPIRTPSPLSFEIGGAYLFSANNRSTETYVTTNDYGGEERSWRTGTQMWYFQAMATYQITSSISGVLGFRYDSFVTKFSEPENLVGNRTILFHTADFTVNADIPFFGVEYSRRFMHGSTINAGIIGLPAFPCDLLHRETRESIKKMSFNNGSDSGYFLEAWAGLSLPITPWLQAGAFSKYSGANAKTMADLSLSGTDNNSQYKTEVTFDRGVWIVAGFVGASF